MNIYPIHRCNRCGEDRPTTLQWRKVGDISAYLRCLRCWSTDLTRRDS